MRLAGEQNQLFNDIMQRSKETFAKVRRNSNEQIRRDVAAAYGQVIPFDWCLFHTIDWNEYPLSNRI